MHLKYPGETVAPRGLKLLGKLICIMLVEEPRMKGNMSDEEKLDEYWWHFNSNLISAQLPEKLNKVTKFSVPDSSLTAAY